MKEISLLILSIKDYFTKPMLVMILYPLLGSAFVLYISFFTIANKGLDTLQNTHLQIEQQQTHIDNGIINKESSKESYTGSSIIDYLLQYTITSWIVSFFVYTIGLFAIGYLSIFISLLIVGLLTPKILSIIHKKHYPNIKINGYGTITRGILKLIKSLLVMITLFIVMLPFYFIPLINIIAINLPFYYFFHKMLHYDVGSTLMQEDKFKQLYYFDKSSMRIKTGLLYFISLVPFVAFFISIFYIIYLGHTYFQLLENKDLPLRESFKR